MSEPILNCPWHSIAASLKPALYAGLAQIRGRQRQQITLKLLYLVLSGTNGGGYEATLLGQTALDYMYAFLWQLPAWMYMLQEMTGKSADRLEKSCSWWSGRLAGRLQMR